MTFVDTRVPHVQAALKLADLGDERETKYGPLAPLVVIALDEHLDGRVPSLLDLENWESRMERWSAAARGTRAAK